MTKNPITKYIYKVHGKWNVRKSIKNKVHYFGTYDTLDEAIRVAEFLQDNNWDRELLEVMVEMGEI